MPNFDAHHKYGKYSSLTLGLLSTILTGNMLIGILSTINSYLSSLYPDTDIKSTSQKIILVSLILISSLAFFILKDFIPVIIILTALFLIPVLAKHRGITHNFLFGIVYQLSVMFIINNFIPLNLQKISVLFASGYIGFAIHILLDKFYKHK